MALALVSSGTAKLVIDICALYCSSNVEKFFHFFIISFKDHVCQGALSVNILFLFHDWSHSLFIFYCQHFALFLLTIYRYLSLQDTTDHLFSDFVWYNHLNRPPLVFHDGLHGMASIFLCSTEYFATVGIYLNVDHFYASLGIDASQR